MFSFTYGSKDNLVDFLHWDNFVLAHYLAAKALYNNPTVVVSIDALYPSLFFIYYLQTGKPYFISDGKPINNFMFFKPLVNSNIELWKTIIYFKYNR